MPWSEVKVVQLCLTLCDPMDYTVHGILQARILEWVAFPFSRGSFQPRDQTQVSCIAGRFFTSWVTRKAQTCLNLNIMLLRNGVDRLRTWVATDLQFVKTQYFPSSIKWITIKWDMPVFKNGYIYGMHLNTVKQIKTILNI